MPRVGQPHVAARADREIGGVDAALKNGPRTALRIEHHDPAPSGPRGMEPSVGVEGE